MDQRYHCGHLLVIGWWTKDWVEALQAVGAAKSWAVGAALVGVAQVAWQCYCLQHGAYHLGQPASMGTKKVPAVVP